MPELMNDTNDTNIVEELRSITEKADINQYLKTSLGGYTKSSVLEYLNLLRRQQQTMAETFSKNQQILFEEKEQLKKSNDAIRTRLSQIEAEYRNLSNAVQVHDLEDKDYSSADIIALKSNISSLEDALNNSGIEKSQLEQQIEQHVSTIKNHELKLKQAAQEKRSLQETLKAEMTETKKLHSTIAQLSGTIEEKDSEIAFLKSMISEGQLSILSEKVSDLTQQLETQTEVLINCNKESSTKSETIDTLNTQNETLKQNAATLTKNLEEVQLQNERLMTATQTLADQLEAEYKRTLTLIKEKSFITSEKLVALRKLDLASAKLTLLELELKNKNSSTEIDTLNQRTADAEASKAPPEQN